VPFFFKQWGLWSPIDTKDDQTTGRSPIDVPGATVTLSRQKWDWGDALLDGQPYREIPPGRT
jgi:hypothetical protein